jgi:hypothetical protein
MRCSNPSSTGPRDYGLQWSGSPVVLLSLSYSLVPMEAGLGITAALPDEGNISGIIVTRNRKR